MMAGLRLSVLSALTMVVWGSILCSSIAMDLCEFEALFPGETDDCFSEKAMHKPRLVNASTEGRFVTQGSVVTSELQSEVTSVYSAATELLQCPGNMVLSNCSCQASCANPNECDGNCTMNGTSCVCLEGFLMDGGDCVPPETCGCFDPEMGVIAEGTNSSNDNCSKLCHCVNNTLTCSLGYRCDVNALCEDSNGTRDCHCSSGYRGDGTTCTEIIPTDCYDVYASGSVEDGVYAIKPSGWSGAAFEVYYNMSDGGGWTVFQRRLDGSVDFYRDWASYKTGFGTPTAELWLGNERLHHLSAQSFYKMRVDVVTRHGVAYNISFELFYVGDEAEQYQLSVGEFAGNTGYDYMANHHLMAFTTHDRDNDKSDENCASLRRGGWWYSRCYTANLNGNYSSTSDDGVALFNRQTSRLVEPALAYTQMRIRPL